MPDAEGLSGEQTELWKTQTATGRRAEPSWRAEEERIAALPEPELVGLDPAALDDWQRCLVAERLIGMGSSEDAVRFLIPVGVEGKWHPAVSYVDLFDSLAAEWQRRAAPDMVAQTLERNAAHAQAEDAENAPMAELNFAQALCDAGDIDRALGIFTRRIRAQPLDPWIYTVMGDALAEAGRPTWAAAVLKRGLEVLRHAGDPEHLGILFLEQLDDLPSATAPAGRARPMPQELAALLQAHLPPAPAAPPPALAPAVRPRRVIKVGRNDPCPCGSGKKYKRCCGA